MTKEKEQKPVPHPKNNEELKKILAEAEEFGGSDKVRIKNEEWTLKGKTVDF